MKTPRGFTLIELLVVIAIIGMLSSIVLASLNTARGKARDASRAESMHTLVLDLQLYYDQYGCLPVTWTGTSCGPASGVYNDGNTDGYGGWDTSSIGTFVSFLKTANITQNVPVDPVNNHAQVKEFLYYCYSTASGANAGGCTAGGLCLAYYNEAGQMIMTNDPSVACK